jgi:hypothetical protein
MGKNKNTKPKNKKPKNKKPKNNNKCKRKNADYQWTELFTILFIIFDYDYIMSLSKDDLIKLIEDNKDKMYITCIEKYISDFMKEKPKNIKNGAIKMFYDTIQRFKTEIINKHGDIKKMFLAGKNYNNIKDKEFQIIKDINKKLEEENPNDKKKICKADINILFNNNTHIGISVKKDNKCTDLNNSVQKLLSEIVNIKLSKTLNNIKNNILTENNVTKTNYNKIKIRNTQYNKFNDYFRETTNEYFNALSDNIIKYSDKIIERLLSNMFSCNNKEYDIYKLWDTDYKLLKLNNCIIKDMKIIIDEDKTNKSNAAKRFFKLKYKNEDFITFEFRFKGNPFNSPQFQTTTCNFEVLSS